MATANNIETTSVPGAVISLKPQTVVKGDSNTQRALRRLRRHKMSIFGVVLLALILVYVTVGSFIYSEKFANATDTSIRLQAPTDAHPFGTDEVGRDILARTIWGGQISLFIAVTAVLVEILVGTLVGLIAGYFGGWVDSLLSRFIEAMLSIPQLFLALLSVRIIADKLPPNFVLGGREFSNTLVVMIFVIGLTSWMTIALIVRATVLSLKEQEFITAARSIGAPSRRIVLRHILPNCIAPLLVAATLGVAQAILLEAYLGFLGLGIRPPTATWGSMLATSYSQLDKWFMWFYPSVLLVMTVLGVNFLGDGLRDALDPKGNK